LSATPENTPAITFSVDTVTTNTVTTGGYEKISLGATQMTLLRFMGSPSRELSPDIWVYHGYRADLALADEEGCDTLVITFAEGKVADLKLVNHSVATIMAANLKSNHTGRLAKN
jgi:hypothetical protein